MGKNSKAKKLGEGVLAVPVHTQLVGSTVPLVDTHTHVLSTFDAYRAAYPAGAHADVFALARGLLAPRGVRTLVDVWCEAPVLPAWRELADAGEKWGDINYRFVMGVHPHQARDYTDAVEADILEAMAHPRCVGWGEMGLDYHYDNSPRVAQQAVFARQLRHAVRLGKPLTIHTREAEDDTERILKELVPREHPIHVHCFTDSPGMAGRLLAHFPNLYIGITGVITYKTNMNTAQVVRDMVGEPGGALRILLETDAPFMVPSNMYADIPDLGSSSRAGRLPLSHAGMLPWTAAYVAEVANVAAAGGPPWDAARVLEVANANARAVYGV